MFAAALVPASAQAEGLFGAILNLFGGGRLAAPEASAPPPHPASPTANPLDQFGLNGQPVPPSHGGPQVAFCVRTCDGRYFPLPRNLGANTSPAKICSAMCPTAETKIYSGSNIENAVSPDGGRYANLKNAFVYRERLIDGCSCNGGDGAGNAAIDIKADPTLRPGDIVVTDKGPLLFKGSKGAAQSGELAPIGDNARISPALRQKISAIKVAKPGTAPVAASHDTSTVKLPVAAKPVSDEETLSPAETAARIFDFRDFDNVPLRGSAAMGYNPQQ